MTPRERAWNRLTVDGLDAVIDLIRSRDRGGGMHVYPDRLDHAMGDLVYLRRVLAKEREVTP